MQPEANDDSMMMDHCAMECMEAIESKDKEKFKQAFHVLVSDVLHKLSDEMETKEGK